MAKSKFAPDPAVVKQVADEVQQLLQAQAAPDGAQAGLGALGGKLGKLLPAMIGPALEIAGMGKDGNFDVDKARRAVGIVVEFIQRLRSGGG